MLKIMLLSVACFVAQPSQQEKSEEHAAKLEAEIAKLEQRLEQLRGELAIIRKAKRPPENNIRTLHPGLLEIGNSGQCT